MNQMNVFAQRDHLKIIKFVQNMSKMKKNHHQKIQNKLPKGEEKPGNRDQMDISTRPIGPG